MTSSHRKNSKFQGLKQAEKQQNFRACKQLKIASLYQLIFQLAFSVLQPSNYHTLPGSHSAITLLGATYSQVALIYLEEL